MTRPTSMRAVILTGHGGLDKLEYREDWPIPAPAAGEVLIKVGACGLNNTDINTRTAWYSKAVHDGITLSSGSAGFAVAEADVGGWGSAALQFPRVQGADVAGRIVAIGDGVDTGRIGERVIVDPWLLGPEDWFDAKSAAYFGSECDGGFADFTTVRGDNAIRIESPLSDAELATFPCAYTTAENLISRTCLKPGEAVVIAGASGGVGSAAIQLCRLRGARVIAIASRSKAALLEELGAETVIDRASPDLAEAIRAAVGGGVDVALDVVGGSVFGYLIEALRHGGRYSTSGAIAGPVVEFDLRQLVYKDLQLTGATIVPPGTASRLVRLIERGLLKPILAAQYPLRELAAAQQAFMEKRHVGNIVVAMS
ncbi:Zn-dependent oxidoreductase, NADPH:quinone reductase [Mesorhizobium australicum WSM2073]|uniref:Zn-dependent oxidoreductase, NADPH:quinone reductase n=3 Tax=Mesorhizobium TaxID=68287 RepID=L0KRK0_MESAW|nr:MULTISPECIES: alcohol dehydrogenase family protein [Mesorhizobium]ADV14809.1 Alcohol dehydrogenase zinc-binding domain protein [Mesorhizobium ciceri biovar biserrulae WSM1271]AEH90696.1 Alcohol dehydrogenase zinc-binding domain protein [Mesorhizobium opportunistum WSM2075]AGB48067.1 Zn-dependent oxidoreductase, NADPH:quinone reductase [Mesorhizobium australicum WSM2073]OBP89848.1 alcohol dehydrogenase [Mesorhizobium loti]